MKRSIFLLPLILLLFVSCDMADDDSDDEIEAKYTATMLHSGDTAPEFTLAGVDYDSVSLAEYRGQYVVLDFWASWCPDCQKVLPEMVEIYERYKNKAAFLGISFDNDRQSLATAIAEYGLEYPQVSEFKAWKETEIYSSYKISWIPAFYVVDPEGRVAFATVTAGKLEDFLKGL